MNVYRRANSSPLALGRELNSGGEGKIFAVVGEPQLVAKIYHKYLPERAAKLKIMLTNPPLDPTRPRGHISIAWPTEALLDINGRYIGFLMPYIDTSASFPLLKLYHPQDRRQTMPGFTWRYLLRTARNFASALQALHDSGYVVGDLNESNILVTSTALVTLVDCDSMQVCGHGQVFRCPVSKPEYTPPELQGQNFNQVVRSKYHDDFGLTVLIFLLLMEGRHPFTGVWKGSSVPPTLEQNIRAGNFPYSGRSLLVPPRNALAFETIPPPLQKLMKRCFTQGHRHPHRRPTAQQWYQALTDLERRLAVCNTNKQHIYSDHLWGCPWCDRIRSGIPDPFPPMRNTIGPPPVQTSTPLSPRTNNPRRSINATFGCIIPIVLFSMEGFYWYFHQTLLNGWFGKASTIQQAVIVLAVLALPFIASSILYEFRRWLRSSQRVHYNNRAIRRR